jgi:hypothetical protein
MPDKSETYRVEGVNAELRHYLARLARKSRCFSRCVHALCRAIKLFVFAWNRRQLYRQRYPDYPAHLIDFVSPLIFTTPQDRLIDSNHIDVRLFIGRNFGFWGVHQISLLVL